MTRQLPDMSDDGPRFWTQEIETMNVADLLVNLAVTTDPVVSHRLLGGDVALVGVVDDEHGGIVAYAIGDENADRIAAALEAAR